MPKYWKKPVHDEATTGLVRMVPVCERNRPPMKPDDSTVTMRLTVVDDGISTYTTEYTAVRTGNPNRDIGAVIGGVVDQTLIGCPIRILAEALGCLIHSDVCAKWTESDLCHKLNDAVRDFLKGKTA